MVPEGLVLSKLEDTFMKKLTMVCAAAMICICATSARADGYDPQGNHAPIPAYKAGYVPATQEPDGHVYPASEGHEQFPSDSE